MKINEYFKDYLEFWGGITIFDDRKDDKRELPDDLKNQLKNKIEDFIAKKYGKDEYSEEKDDWIAFPFTKINILIMSTLMQKVLVDQMNMEES